MYKDLQSTASTRRNQRPAVAVVVSEAKNEGNDKEYKWEYILLDSVGRNKRAKADVGTTVPKKFVSATKDLSSENERISTVKTMLKKLTYKNYMSVYTKWRHWCRTEKYIPSFLHTGHFQHIIHSYTWARPSSV